MELSEQYQFCPRCGLREGRSDSSRAGPSPFKCAACGFVHYFNPACAVAGLVVDANGRMLFIRRAREPARGKLALPGGFIDSGEAAEEALRREIFEEVGLRLDHLEYLGSWPNRYPTPSGDVNVCDLFFKARPQDTETSSEAEEVAELLWLQPEEVAPNDLAFDSMRAAVTAFLASASLAND